MLERKPEKVMSYKLQRHGVGLISGFKIGARNESWSLSTNPRPGFVKRLETVTETATTHLL